MEKPSAETFDLADAYVHLEDGGGAEAMMLTPSFWQELASGGLTTTGWLVGRMRVELDTPNWEMHPLGEELLYLLSGAVDIVLEQEETERVVALRGGDAYLVPRGTWHRQVVLETSDMIFMTYGTGTEHRPLEPEAA